LVFVMLHRDSLLGRRGRWRIWTMILLPLHMMRERKVLIISMLMVIVMTMAMHMQEIAEVEMGGGAAKYREEYKQNIGSTERGTDLD